MQHLSAFTLTSLCCLNLLFRRDSNQEAQCSTRDPTSSHDLRKWQWNTQCDGQCAAERREQATTGHREAPGPHTCYRGVCHPGGSGAISCVCKCTIPASWKQDGINYPGAGVLENECMQGAVSGKTPTLCYYQWWQLTASVWFSL